MSSGSINSIRNSALPKIQSGRRSPGKQIFKEDEDADFIEKKKLKRIAQYVFLSTGNVCESFLLSRTLLSFVLKNNDMIFSCYPIKMAYDKKSQPRAYPF